MNDRPGRTIRFIRAQVERPTPDGCRALVEVEGVTTGPCSATAEGGSSPLEMLRTVARAAADAVSTASGGAGTSVRVRGIQQVEVFGEVVIIVSMVATRGDTTQSLLGVSHGGEDAARAAALAVLNGTNRFLGVG